MHQLSKNQSESESEGAGDCISFQRTKVGARARERVNASAFKEPKWERVSAYELSVIFQVEHFTVFVEPLQVLNCFVNNVISFFIHGLPFTVSSLLMIFICLLFLLMNCFIYVSDK